MPEEKTGDVSAVKRLLDEVSPLPAGLEWFATRLCRTAPTSKPLPTKSSWVLGSTSSPTHVQ